jgi:hypothetical protein
MLLLASHGVGRPLIGEQLNSEKSRSFCPEDALDE